MSGHPELVILVNYCADPPYTSGSMLTADVAQIPSPVLRELVRRAERELRERDRLTLVLKDHEGRGQ